jgi:hypothetical protein
MSNDLGHALAHDLFKNIIGPLTSTHVAPLLLEPDHIEERVSVLSKTFDAHPTWKEPFRLLIKSLHAQESEIAIEEQIRFFTTKHTRFWLLVNLLNQVLQLKELKLDEATGRLPAKANEILKLANTARIELGEEGRYKDMAFSVGMLFDYLIYLSRTPLIDVGGAKLDEPINQCFTRGIEQGKKIIQLSRHIAKLTHQKSAPITPLLRQLAQATLYLLRPAKAIEFYKKIETLKPTEPVRMAMERKEFGLPSSAIASYLAQTMPVFEHLGEAMSIWGFPYLAPVASPAQKDIHDLVAVGMLGVGVSERLKGPDFGKLGKPYIGMPELRYLDFDLTPEVKNEVKI